MRLESSAIVALFSCEKGGARGLEPAPCSLPPHTTRRAQFYVFRRLLGTLVVENHICSYNVVRSNTHGVKQKQVGGCRRKQLESVATRLTRESVG